MSTSTDRCSGATTRAARGCADGVYLRASSDVSAETPDPWTSPQAEANAGTRQSPCYADGRAVGAPAGSAFERTIIAFENDASPISPLSHAYSSSRTELPQLCSSAIIMTDSDNRDPLSLGSGRNVLGENGPAPREAAHQVWRIRKFP
jgi:hypothetical protein